MEILIASLVLGVGNNVEATYSDRKGDQLVDFADFLFIYSTGLDSLS